ncbi:2-oxoacid:ferredoxin oxidoreductase subunit beta [Candidatus Poribacteria bacterium]|nr:2-oxoacid:ferredoxin oxidoreductase subunit beta [Candidatus Poribacteria bacterium]
MRSAVASAGPALTRDDFQSDQDVRWCPGCGDYSILAQVQRVLPELGVPKENIVFISGIGCSSRFPYYMNTFGFHTIHGRAPAIATGLKLARPELDVWVVTGDGDALSIGGNHFVHLLRRNLDIRVLLFNNQIYGLTKGQYSPTSEQGKVTYSSPMGSIETPFNPMRVALGANASLVARSLDRDTKHLQMVLKRAHEHQGTAFVEIYQDCIVFNKDTFAPLTDRETKDDNVLYLEHGEPMVFGKERDKGIRLDGLQPRVISLTDGQHSVADLLIHDEHDRYGTLSDILATFQERVGFPRPVGIVRNIERVCYEDVMLEQIDKAMARSGPGDLAALLAEGDTWTVGPNGS